MRGVSSLITQALTLTLTLTLTLYFTVVLPNSYPDPNP